MTEIRLKHFLFIFLFAWASACFAQDHQPHFATISAKNAILYENPTTASPIVRRVFNGEVLKIIETVKVGKDEVWGKVFLSPNQFAYIQGMYFGDAENLPQELWKPEEVLRSEMPFSFSIKGPAELYGAGLQFRYLPFARLGLTVGAGAVPDESGNIKGYSVAYGLTYMLSMKGFSPFVETGTSVINYNDSHSTLRISSFYVNAGAEWMLKSGYFFGLGLSYSRSYAVQVEYDYDYAKAQGGNLTLGDYGPFKKVDSQSTFQQLNPLFIAGYSF